MRRLRLGSGGKAVFTSVPGNSSVLAVWQQAARDRQELTAGRWKAFRVERNVGFHELMIAIDLG
jgi:hypothetical protein